MTKLYVTEYVSLTPASQGQYPGQIPLESPIAEQVLDFTFGVATSSAFNARTIFVRLNTDAACSILFGANPTATTSNQRMSANQTEYHGVGAGLGLKVSAITNT